MGIDLGSQADRAIPTCATASAWLPRGGVRLAAGVWLMLTLVLTQMYRSNLKAMMILPRLSLPFDTLEGLIESGIPCYIVPSTKFHNAILVKHSAVIVLREAVPVKCFCFIVGIFCRKLISLLYRTAEKMYSILILCIFIHYGFFIFYV